MTDNQKDLAELVKTCRTNERIARQLFEIETSILALRSYEDLFERLLRLIEEKFDIPHVWISLVDDRKILPVIGILRSAPPLAARLNVIRRKTILSLLGGNADPTLVNNNLKPYYRLFPKNEKYV
ncbi:MAG: hypothetical protein JW884_00105, partial [Deltaproteobacteria bacterium]|nr:hypothetical protein [Deltaproteobacteria bacterium]